MKRNEVILVVLIILAALLSIGGLKWYQSTSASTPIIAVISENKKVIERIDLNNVSESKEIKISGNYEETIIVEKGRIRFKEADCPDKICVKTGWLQKPGDIAVCLPNRVVIKIEED